MKMRRRRHHCHRYNNALYILFFTGVTFFSLHFLQGIWKGKTEDVWERIQWPNVPEYSSNIPSDIIQTSKYSDGTFQNTNNSFIRLNPTYKYIHYNDSTADEFVRATMPLYIYQTYKLLPESVMKADYFRYIVLLVHGGIYSDIDTICLRPIDAWFNRIERSKTGLVVGIEADATWWELFQGDYVRQIQFVQWTIAAAPGHPVLYRVIERIARITSSMKHKTLTNELVLEWTGPGIWTDVLSNYFTIKHRFPVRNLKNLQEPKLIGGDICVLPITAFSPDYVGVARSLFTIQKQKSNIYSLELGKIHSGRSSSNKHRFDLDEVHGDV